MVHHFLHLFEGLALTLLAIGVVIGWVPTMIHYRRKVRKIRKAS